MHCWAALAAPPRRTGWFGCRSVPGHRASFRTDVARLGSTRRHGGTKHGSLAGDFVGTGARRNEERATLGKHRGWVAGREPQTAAGTEQDLGTMPIDDTKALRLT